MIAELGSRPLSMHFATTWFARGAFLSIVLLCGLQGISLADEFSWDNHPSEGTADLRCGSHPVLRYMYAYDTSTPERTKETFKVFHHVFGPGTDQIITNGAGGLFPHHRGLFVGWRRTKFEGQEIDSWHCTKGAHQRHVKFLEMKGDVKHGLMTAEIHWNDTEGKPVIVETRTVDVSPIIAGEKLSARDALGWQIDWRTKLESKRGEVQLDGDRQHAGFQFRAANEVAEQKSARYIRPEGFTQEPDAHEVDDTGDPPRHINLGWLAMTYPLGQHRYTIEYFEDPSLPKPSLFSERPYGRFGAFFKTTVTPEKSLVMKYRVRVTSGDAPTQAQIQKNYDTFVSELKVGK